MTNWEEREHPRDPDGQFANKWAGRIASRLGGLFGHHKRGRDLTAEVNDPKWKSKAKRLAQDANQDDGDVVLADIMRLQGWDVPSRHGTDEELQAAIDHGGVELWRGYQGQAPELWGYGPQLGARAPYHPEHSAMARQRQTVDGDLWVGTGIYGNGWYTSVNRRAGERFASTVWVDEPGGFNVRSVGVSYDPVTLAAVGEDYKVSDPRSLQRMVLSPEARVIDYGDPRLAEFIYRDVAAGRGSSYVAAHERDRHIRSSLVLHDFGQAAAALGYDALRVPTEGHPTRTDGSDENADQYVILNRTAVLFAQPYDEAKLPPRVVTEAQWLAAPVYDFDADRTP